MTEAKVTLPINKMPTAQETYHQSKPSHHPNDDFNAEKKVRSQILVAMQSQPNNHNENRLGMRTPSPPLFNINHNKYNASN